MSSPDRGPGGPGPSLRLVDSHAHPGHLAARGFALADIIRTWTLAGGVRLLDAGVEPGDLCARRAAMRAALASLDAEGFRSPGAAWDFSAGAWPSAAVLSEPGASIAGIEADVAAGACAIGECGLDYHHMEAPRDAQLAFFEACLDLGRRRGLPVIVHTRDAHADTLSRIRLSGAVVRVLIHCFSYDAAAAREYLDSGAWISFAGSLTHKGSVGLREAAALVPADKLLVETDSPYQAPIPWRGKACRPEMVQSTLECLAALRGEGAEDLSGRIEANYLEFFGLRA